MSLAGVSDTSPSFSVACTLNSILQMKSLEPSIINAVNADEDMDEDAKDDYD